MKTNLFVILLIVCCATGFAQTKPVKVLFDVTSKDSLTHQAVLRHVDLMSSNYADSKFEVVVYGGALTMLLKDKSTVSDEIAAAVSAHKNVAFAVCAETMRRQKVDKSQLLPGVVIVPDAIMEIVTKQGEGWGYIKEAHH